MSEFDTLVRGSVIVRWSPSGVLERFVVLKRATFGAYTVRGATYQVAILNEDGSLSIGKEVQHDTDWITAEGIDEDEGFGYTYAYMTGEAYPLPKDFFP